MDFEYYKNKVIENRIQFQKHEEKIKNSGDISDVIAATKFVISNRSSVYYSEIIEKFYIDLAERTKTKGLTPAAITTKTKRFLHVMSRCYLKGGHTRIVERWINASEKDEQHSVYLTEQHSLNDIPDNLKQYVKNRNGVIHIENQTAPIVNKANNLRAFSLDFDVVIMHQHMHDPVPLMAYSVSEYKKLVIVFNHAGHLFWLGRNVADFVIDIEKNQNNITKQLRGVTKSAVINMPVSANQSQILPAKTKTLRKKLSIPQESIVLLTMASDFKYEPTLEFDFPRSIERILEQAPTAIFIGIGLQKRHSIWTKLQSIYQERVVLLGSIPFKEATDYLSVADLYVDSFPMNSWVSMIDAISIGKLPVVSVCTPVGLPLFIEQSSSIAKDCDDFVNKVTNLLNSELLRKENSDELQTLIINCSEKLFRESIEQCINKALSLKTNPLEFNAISSDICELDIHFAAMTKIQKIKRYGIARFLEYTIAYNGMRTVTIIGKSCMIDK